MTSPADEVDSLTPDEQSRRPKRSDTEGTMAPSNFDVIESSSAMLRPRDR